MIDLLIVYCLFMYLFTIGVMMSAWDEQQDIKAGMILWLILAPIATPIYLGIDHESKTT